MRQPATGRSGIPNIKGRTECARSTPTDLAEVLKLEILEVDDPRWADLAGSHPEALPFHHPAWVGLIRDCYGFRSFAAVASTADGSPRAGLPVIEARSPLRRRRWVSLPFTDYCPLLYGSEAARDEVLELLRMGAAAEQVGSVELRTPVGSTASTQTVVGVLHELVLESDCSEVYRRFHKSRVQGSIRRAKREGVAVRIADCEADVVGTYYELHARTRRRLGVPAQPRRFFRLLWERMIEAGLGFVLLAHVGDSAVAGAVFLHWNGHLTYKFGASDETYRDRQPNHAILWEAVRWGCERGYRVLDFGRSGLSDHGLRAFKDGWGAAERPLVYTTLVGSRRPSTDGAAEGALRRVLRRSPVWVCRGAGEVLYRYAA
jgi:CelD/BcsL family acetyltransferase involved in cellulose biosynthesis